MRYKQKDTSRVVEAIQYTGKNIAEVKEFVESLVKDNSGVKFTHVEPSGELYFETPETIEEKIPEGYYIYVDRFSRPCVFTLPENIFHDLFELSKAQRKKPKNHHELYKDLPKAESRPNYDELPKSIKSNQSDNREKTFAEKIEEQQEAKNLSPEEELAIVYSNMAELKDKNSILEKDYEALDSNYKDVMNQWEEDIKRWKDALDESGKQNKKLEERSTIFEDRCNTLREEINRLRQQNNIAYDERNILAVLVGCLINTSRMAQGKETTCGYYTDHHEDAEGFKRVISLMDGRATFHIPDNFPSFNLPEIPMDWDGHTTEEKWEFIKILCGI